MFEPVDKVICDYSVINWNKLYNRDFYQNLYIIAGRGHISSLKNVVQYIEIK